MEFKKEIVNKTNGNIFNFKGIKCDHCAWKNENVSFSEYNLYVNKPCPVCGHTLLTKKDFKKCKIIMSVGEKLDKICSKKDKNTNCMKIKIKWSDLF